jgi:predicted enzyme involved in methoxymalonyl-ACP biosynthesis
MIDCTRQAGKIKCNNRPPDLAVSMQELREYIKLLQLEISHERQKQQHLQRLVQLQQ